MKAVIVNTDQKEPDKATLPQQACTTVQISIKTCRLHYQKQSIHSDMVRFSIHWRLKSQSDSG